MLVKSRTCMNCCMPGNGNESSMVGLFIPSEQFDQIPSNEEIKGSWGPLEWDIDVEIDQVDIVNSTFSIKLTLFGVNVIDSVVDKNHPKIDINLAVGGVGLYATIGVDFNARILYLRGKLDFRFYTKEFDITLVKF